MEVFLPVIRLQGFSWYDFVSFDNSSSAKLGQFHRRIRGWGEFLKVALLFFLRRVSKENRARGSVCGSKNDITESVHHKISLERALEKSKGTSRNSPPHRQCSENCSNVAGHESGGKNLRLQNLSILLKSRSLLL